MASATTTISAPPNKMQRYEDHADGEGYSSLSEFARKAMEEKIQRDTEDN